MESFYWPGEPSVARAAISALAGAVMAFFGYRLFHGAIKIYGLVGGAMLGVGLCRFFLPETAPAWIVPAAAVALALLGLFLIKKLYKLAVFITAAGLGAAVWSAVAPMLTLPAAALLVAPLVAGVVTGFLGLMLERPLMILGTAAFGAAMLTAGGVEGAALAGHAVPHAVVGVAVLALAGGFVQFRKTTPKAE